MTSRLPNFMQYARPSYSVDGATPSGPPLHLSQEQESTLRSQGKSLWRELFLSVSTEDDLQAWKAKIPKYGCSCSDFYLAYEVENPPTFPLPFRWKYDLKSAVNAKLNHPNITYEQAFAEWYGTQFARPVRRKRHRKVVTAIGPNRIERQRHCISTWIDAGFDVIAMQTGDELTAFKTLFSDLVIDWVLSDDVDSFYNFKTQRIRNLVSIAGAMLINSDCEMSGDCELDETDSISEFFIRWNYSDGVYIAREFEWGLDGVYLTNEAKSVIPKDFPFCIGQAMWDYALPCILQKAGIPFRINHGQWLLHLDHLQNWTDEYWWKGAHWMQGRYGINPMWFRETYRKDLEPDWKYNRITGKWEPK